MIYCRFFPCLLSEKNSSGFQWTTTTIKSCSGSYNSQMNKKMKHAINRRRRHKEEEKEMEEVRLFHVLWSRSSFWPLFTLFDLNY
ncbi:Protein CBG27667 [Caenorhabditis briggsae]|uniref:Protein CBG27667 n=1 Tax=Caenorhabditis briggsae TaxID=6238 RepID=B6IJB2_CAEBR|nr:Protein CBG27667 [Caenorhabditis briggsae]CAR99946.1 Protein CBG27667 [Caenorhabditis briggsae]